MKYRIIKVNNDSGGFYGQKYHFFIQRRSLIIWHNIMKHNEGFKNWYKALFLTQENAKRYIVKLEKEKKIKGNTPKIMKEVVEKINQKDMNK